MKKKYYHYKDLLDFIDKLSGKNYECVQTWEGSLGIGNWICIPPDDKHYYFIIHEEYLNSQSSIHSMMKCSKFPKKWEAELKHWEKYSNGCNKEAL